MSSELKQLLSPVTFGRLQKLTFPISFFILTICSAGSCKKPPFKTDYENIGGYVIEKETCNIDETQNYWLLDFTVYPNSPKVGDTLVLNGVTYKCFETEGT